MSRISGSAGLREWSTARMTTEPLWRMTSRRAVTPPGSTTWSAVTEKTLPLYTVFDERRCSLPGSFVPSGAGLATVMARGSGADFLRVGICIRLNHGRRETHFCIGGRTGASKQARDERLATHERASGNAVLSHHGFAAHDRVVSRLHRRARGEGRCGAAAMVSG